MASPSPTPTLSSLLADVIAAENALSAGSQAITNDSNVIGTAQSDLAAKQAALDTSTAALIEANSKLTSDSSGILNLALGLQTANNALIAFLTPAAPSVPPATPPAGS